MLGITLSIDIQLERDTYYPGEKVKGVVSLNVSKPLRAREVVLSFVGREHTRVVRGSGKNRHVYLEDFFIVQEVVSLWAASPNGYLGPSNEMFPFEFQIPVDALPSTIVKSNDADTIAYEVKAKIDRPLAFDPNVTAEIHVDLPVIESYPTTPLMDTFQDPQGRDRLEVSVAKNVFTPGETVSGIVKFKRTPELKARAVECSLFYTESATAHGHTDNYPYIIGRHRWDLDPSGEYYEFQFNFPTNPSGDFSVEGRIIRCSWIIDVKVDLPLKRDQHVQVPLLFLPLRNPVTP